MSFSDNFIKKPVLTTVCSILIVLVGLIAIPTLPIANLPNIADPLIQVSAVYGGANAEVTEQAVTNPIEQQINGVPGVAYIASNSDMTGSSSINVYFDQTTDIDIDQVNVQNRVSLAMPQLPEQVSATGVSVKQSNPSILLAYEISSSEGQYDAAYLNGLVYEQLYYPLSRVEGVATVSVFGGANPAFWLFVDPDKLAANQLTAEDVLNAVQSQNSVAVGGLVGGPPCIRRSGLHLPNRGGEQRQPHLAGGLQQPDRQPLTLGQPAQARGRGRGALRHQQLRGAGHRQERP